MEVSVQTAIALATALAELAAKWGPAIAAGRAAASATQQAEIDAQLAGLDAGRRDSWAEASAALQEARGPAL
jgi:hypothetical protein